MHRLSSRYLTAGVFALVALGLAGCDRIGGRTVMVEFSSAEGLPGGRPVYFAGVQIGSTGAPAIVAGKARVPVHLHRKHREAVTSGAVFAIANDPAESGARCLQGYAVGTAPRDENGTPIYQGVTNELELALLLGAEKARELMEQFKQ